MKKEIEDEIDLKELFQTIWKNKWKIIFLSVLVTTIVLFKMIRTPNVYQSSIVLVPEEKGSSMGQLGALAGFAGVNVGGGAVSVFTKISTILKDKIFLDNMIRKYKLIEKLENPQNLVFAFGLDFKKDVKENKLSEEERFYLATKQLSKSISIVGDATSSLITISVSSTDRFFAKELVDILLLESTRKLRELDMKDINSRIEYYEQELRSIDNIELQKSITKIISSLIEKRVLSNANENYLLNKITESRVPFIKDKTKPKRGMLVVLAFIGSMILGVVGALFLEFLRTK
jgi:uncharacterized protein involved in exopolysaccharide biosynthesis